MNALPFAIFVPTTPSQKGSIVSVGERLFQVLYASDIVTVVIEVTPPKPSWWTVFKSRLEDWWFAYVTAYPERNGKG